MEDVPLIVVGSKVSCWGRPCALLSLTRRSQCDLDTDREVPTSEGKTLAEKFDVPFFETSAKTRVNVDEVSDGVSE